MSFVLLNKAIFIKIRIRIRSVFYRIQISESGQVQFQDLYQTQCLVPVLYRETRDVEPVDFSGYSSTRET